MKRLVSITFFSLIGAGTLGAAALPAHASFSLGDAANYTLLFTGAGNNKLSITNDTVTGNIGVGGSGVFADSGPSTINGSVDFAAANTDQFNSTNGSNVLTGSVNYNIDSVTTALTTISSLSNHFADETGTSLAINLSGNTNQTVNATSGALDTSGNYVFNVTQFNNTTGNTITINGSSDESVVFNFTSNANFDCTIALIGGIIPSHVLFNVTSTNTLQFSANSDQEAGIFIDPNGTITCDNVNITGGLYGGDSHNFQFGSGANITGIPTPEPGSGAMIVLGLPALL